ncbi:MAG TPA: hypothetical protein PK926_12665 [Spirochaetota bacterium]|nr:hypothetical protein [Spirochaetota bacterium]HPR49090.1 hypothetical protein [Spirochaetota bacterium]
MKNPVILFIMIVMLALFSCDDVDSPSDPVGTLKVTYDFFAVGDFGTLSGSATGQVYVYLVQKFALYPDYNVIQSASSGSSTASTGTITINNVYVGYYYVVVFYDQNYDEDWTASSGDPYAIYDATQSGNATSNPYDACEGDGAMITMTKGHTLDISITYSGSDEFTSRNAWLL